MSLPPSLASRFLGYAVIAAGIVLVCAAGAFIVTLVLMAVQPQSRGGDTGLIWVSLGFGLPFMAAGFALVVWGRSLSKRQVSRG